MSLLCHCQAAAPAPAGASTAIVDPQGLVRIGVNADATAVDPHFSFIDPNVQATSMFYERLFQYGADKELLPMLARGGASRPDDPRVWDIQLEPDVRFHFGQSFTKRDVLCTLRRVASFTLAKGGYAGQIASIDLPATAAAIEADLDPLKLTIVTKQPNPFLPTDLATITIMGCDEAKQAEALAAGSGDPSLSEDDRRRAVLEAFANGSLVNGTGPYRFRSYVTLAADPAAAKIEADAWDGYRGQRPAWPHVALIPVTDANARVDRLLAGELDFVNAVPASRIADLEAASFSVYRARSLRVMHMWMYQGADGREETPLHAPVTDERGAPRPNPFRSREFRRACSLASDRELFLGLTQGMAVPTSQMLPPGRVGHLPEAPANPFDVEAARRAFAAASKEPGFEFLQGQKLKMKVHGPKDRYPYDGEALQTIAAAWTAAFGDFTVDGVHYSLTVEPAVEPQAAYFANANKYLVGLLGGGIANGHAQSALQLYLTPGSGLNYGKYDNPEVTRQYQAGASTMQEAERDAALTRTLKAALDDYGVIPLYNPLVAWAGSPRVSFTPRIDDVTFPAHVGRR